MNAPLKLLNKLILQGMDFPDALYRVSCGYGCCPDVLKHQYDQQFTAENGTTTE
jgi:hypothetical protein